MVMTQLSIPAMPYGPYIIRFRLAGYLLAEMSDTLWTQLNQLNVEPCIHTSSCVDYALYVQGMHVLCRAKLIINFNTLFYSSVRQLTNEDIQSWLQSYLPLLTDIKDGKMCIIQMHTSVHALNLSNHVTFRSISYIHGGMMSTRMVHQIDGISSCYLVIIIIFNDIRFCQLCYKFILSIEALAYQMMGLFKGDQQYSLGVYLADKFAHRSGDVS